LASKIWQSGEQRCVAVYLQAPDVLAQTEVDADSVVGLQAMERIVAAGFDQLGPHDTLILVALPGRARQPATELEKGVLLLVGGRIRADALIERATIMDVTPTLLTLMGVPMSGKLDGGPLLEGLEPTFLRRYPPQYVVGYGPRHNRGEPQAAASDQVQLEQLRALGYIQ
jgi:hypothetical protein